MPPKPLINENLLQKITKVQPFHIRSKHTPLKSSSGSKSLKNIEIVSPINKQLQACIELVNLQLQNTPINNRDFLQRIAKLLLELRTKWQPIEQPTLQVDSEQQEITPQMKRKSSSKYFSKSRFQVGQQSRFAQGNFFTDKSTGQLKKNKLNKLKIGKENNQRFIATHELKLEKLSLKLQESEKLGNEQKQQIERLKQQVESLMEINQQLNKLKQQSEQEINTIKHKMQLLFEEKKNLENDFAEKIVILQRNKEQIANECVILRYQLQERERQLASLWQLQKF